MADHIAVVEVEIDAPAARVWQALVDPEQVMRYMFGAEVESDWKPGNPVVWHGDWEGKPFEGRGEVLEIGPPRFLKLTHSSGAAADGARHVLGYELLEAEGRTTVRLSQGGNASEEGAEHARGNWEAMLAAMKGLVEAS
ncbi:MAG TPA: SRPBCC family protein [Acidimicrobiales bacterium]|nr:SRPBCC family protein [Acidimicrobiales bacterium]